MGLQITNTVSALAVFVQGILSFFSPCVLPLVPVYLSYLAGDAGTEGQPPRRRRLRLLTSTLFFVLGISFAIFTLGMGVSALGQFFSQSRQVFTVIGGLVLIVLGLVQLGLFGRHGFYLSVDYANRSGKNDCEYSSSVLTASPRYLFDNGAFHLQAGVTVALSDSKARSAVSNGCKRRWMNSMATYMPNKAPMGLNACARLSRRVAVSSGPMDKI